MFDTIESSVSLPRQEDEIIRFWKERQIYEKSLAARAGRPAVRLLRGAAHGQRPAASGPLPDPGHQGPLPPLQDDARLPLPSARPAGTPTACRSRSRSARSWASTPRRRSRRFGVEPFVHRCLESVFRYMQQWEELTERLGFWIHLDEAYVTFHQSYVESVWWALKTLFDRGLLVPGPQDRLVVGPGRDGAFGRRSRPGLPRSGRPERLRPLPAGSAVSPLPPGEGRGEGEGRVRAETSRTPICWSGPPRPGRCRPTSSPR